MGLVDRQVIQNRLNVVRGESLRIGRGVFGHIRRRIAACVKRYGAITPPEVAQLGLPTSKIPGEFVDEDNGPSFPGLFVVEPYPIIRDGVGHISGGSLQGCETSPIQKRLLAPPVSTSYFRTKSSSPSPRTRKTAKPAGIERTPLPSRTE